MVLFCDNAKEKFQNCEFGMRQQYNKSINLTTTKSDVYNRRFYKFKWKVI